MPEEDTRRQDHPAQSTPAAVAHRQRRASFIAQQATFLARRQATFIARRCFRPSSSVDLIAERRVRFSIYPSLVDGTALRRPAVLPTLELGRPHR